MRSKRERVGVAEARAKRFFESPFSGLEKLFPVRVALSRFETFSAYVRDLLGAATARLGQKICSFVGLSLTL